MTFTDDDLKRLKMYPGSLIDVEALLARLEAAELLAECLSNHEDLDPIEITEIKAWRQSAGKGART